MAIKVDADLIFVDWWQERDRTSIVVFKDEDRDVTVAEWWDEDAQSMMEDGFFKWHDDDSVIDYLDEIGLIEFIDPDE
jgi:hypothetical protein